jgi:hypothetical protein
MAKSAIEKRGLRGEWTGLWRRHGSEANRRAKPTHEEVGENVDIHRLIYYST